MGIDSPPDRRGTSDDWTELGTRSPISTAAQTRSHRAEHSRGSRWELPTFFAIAALLSWTLWLPLMGAHYGWWGQAWAGWHLVGGLGPALAALTVTGFAQGRTGLRHLLAAATRWRAGWFAWTLAVGGPLFLMGAGILAVRAGGQDWPSLDRLTHVSEYSNLSLLALLGAEVLFYGIGEELGWRGFALPRMATRSGLLLGALSLSVPWALWHLPLLLINDTYSAMSPLLLGGWFFSLMTGSVLLAFLWKVSGGSVLVVAVFHGVLDVAMVNTAITANAVTAQGAVVSIMGVAAAIWLWRSVDHRGTRASKAVGSRPIKKKRG